MRIRIATLGPLIVTIGVISACSKPNSGDDALAKLQAQVSKLASPLLVTDADLRIKVSQAVFAKIMTAISALPSNERQATFDGKSASGYVWSQGGGFLGCGGYAEINSGGRDFHFTVNISNLNATWRPDGRMAVHLDAAANAWGTIHGHIKGPAGACSGPSLKYPVGRWSCDCPIGGGFGTVVGISANKGSAFDGFLTIAPKSDGQIAYALVLTSPQSLSVTVSAGLQRIGNIGIPMTFSLPSSPLIQGAIAGVLTDRGVLTVAGSEQPYSLNVSDVRVRSNASGLELLANAKVSAP